MRKKYIVITGWVISWIGKGVTTASIGFFLSETCNVCPIKLDGYLNIDPGTMNPVEHGEVYVLADGGEVDMDFWHYERFLGVECSSLQSISMGKIYAGILEKERRGDYLGKTVQMIPHVTNHIVERLEEVFVQSNWDICMIEVGGTVWDIEVELYLEAIRQMKSKKRGDDFLHIHMTYVPIPGWVGEQKTKPTQQSLNLLQSRGLFPDIIIARWRKKLTKETREKIALFSNLQTEKVFSIPDVESIYTIPSILAKQKFDELVQKRFKLEKKKSKKLTLWEQMMTARKKARLKIGIIWKYTALEDSYSSVLAALEHAWYFVWVAIELHYIDARKTEGISKLQDCDACIIPGGFWESGVEHMIEATKFLRENKIPTLGICLWLQLMLIEYMRNKLNTPNANSIEFDKKCTPYDVITLLDSQKNIMNLWGTMRLGKQISVMRNSMISELYRNLGRLESEKFVSEKFRHRYEVNPVYAEKLSWSPFKIVWSSKKEWIVQFMEMDNKEHPYFVGTQAHPELSTKLESPSPLFVWLLEWALKCRK